MPKSSRHRSSKHSSRDARDYSDSDNDSSPKERRGGSDDAGARASKDSGFSEKRKIDSKECKELYGSGNGEYVEEHVSSKRRKEKTSDRVSDRWNGGSEEGSTKVKPSSESKSRRRDEESEDVKRSGKSEMHKESSRKEGRDSDRKEREGRGDKSIDNEDNATDLKMDASVESEILEKRSRRKKDNYDAGDVKDKDKHTYSGDDTSKARRKDEKHKDERHRDDRNRDKYREEGDKDSRDRYEKQKDDYLEKDRNGSRSDKHVKSERDTADDRQRKSKPRDSDRDLESGRDRDRDHYRDKERDHGRDRDRDYDHNWDRDHDGDRDRERGRGRERDRDSVREKEKDRDLEHDQERYRDRERDRDRDLDDYSARHKDHRGKKRSPDDRDDYSDSRPRSTKARNSETEKRPMSSSRVEADDRLKSQSHQGHSESTRRRGSPTSNSHGGGGADEYRLSKEDTKYKESLKEGRARAISPRESALSGPTDRGLKYASYDRNNKTDDVRAGDFSAERSSSSKASPVGLSDRSPSATSLERRNTNRNAARRNLDVEELGRKTGTDGRDFPIAEGRISRDRPIEKPSGDEYTQADSSFHSKPGFSNTSSIPAQPPRSAAESSPFPGLSEEDSNRGNSNFRFRRNNDSSVGRGHGNNNNWRGVPNWSSPMPNGFMPFQHGPHGNFQAMMPHFPTPPLFAVRPPMELNQSGMPYHLPDADRYPGHLRPYGWQNMIDASGLPRFHGWDGSGVLRDEPHMYPTPDWDQSRHMMNVRGWETNNTTDTWKGHNGDMNMDLSSVSRKEEQPISATDDDGSSGQGQGSDKGNSQQQKTWGRGTEIKQEIHSPAKEIPKLSSSKTSNATSELSELPEGNDGMDLCRAYLSNLDISMDLADPESYKQYVGLVGGKQTVIVNESPSVCMILAGYGRVMPQSSGASLSASVFPAVSKSITQRAMELYRKQRLEPWSIPVAVGGLVDLISSTKKNNVDEQGGEPKTENLSKELLNSGTVIAPDDGKKVEVVSHPPAKKIPNDDSITASTKEQHSTDDQGERVESMDVETLKESATGSNEVSVPFVVDGSLSGEALMMSDSDASKIVNLSRIQQSPESTH